MGSLDSLGRFLDFCRTKVAERPRHLPIQKNGGFSTVPSPAQAAQTARFADVAKELRENGVALCKGFFDPATVNNLEQWWKAIQNKIESGQLNRQNRFVNLIRNQHARRDIF